MNVTVTADTASLQAATDIYHESLGWVKYIAGITASLKPQLHPVSQKAVRGIWREPDGT